MYFEHGCEERQAAMNERWLGSRKSRRVSVGEDGEPEGNDEDEEPRVDPKVVALLGVPIDEVPLASLQDVLHMKDLLRARRQLRPYHDLIKYSGVGQNGRKK